MFAPIELIAETGKLQKFAMRLTRNKSDAVDLLQSTCLRALEKNVYFEDGSNLFSWTSKIMYNIFVSGYRRKAKFETQYDPEIFLQKKTVDSTQEIQSEFAAVGRAMTQLSDNHREIILLVCVQGMRYEEVAGKLNIPVGTVRSRLSRVREDLLLIMNTPIIPAYNTSSVHLS